MGNGGCAVTARCTSTGPGTNSCACNAGYSGDGITCTSIDNCLTSNGGCDTNAACAQTGPGTNSCTCNAGYSGDGTTCSAVNPCPTNNGGCDTNATCAQTGPGTNSCTCNAGYSGDGTICTLISSVTLSDFGNGFDFDTSMLVARNSGSVDLYKLINFGVANGATQVDTGISASSLASVHCNASDGRTYSSISIDYSQPNSTVICLHSSAGSYFKYIGEQSCCGRITLDYAPGN